ncbi:HU family DNA-binding protein [Patescibacteria group bacterium]
MNKAELAARLADQLGISKKLGEDFVATFEDIVTHTLMNGGEVTIAGFGTFSARERKGRMGVNPQNPSEKIEIPSVVVPKFKAGKALKDSLKGKRGGPSQPILPPVEPETPESQQPTSF